MKCRCPVAGTCWMFINIFFGHRCHSSSTCGWLLVAHEKKLYTTHQKDTSWVSGQPVTGPSLPSSSPHMESFDPEVWVWFVTTVSLSNIEVKLRYDDQSVLIFFSVSVICKISFCYTTVLLYLTSNFWMYIHKHQRETNNVLTFVTFRWVSDNIVFASVETRSEKQRRSNNILTFVTFR